MSSDLAIVEGAYTTILGNAKIKETIDKVLEVVPIDDPNNEVVKTMVMDADRQSSAANLILARFCGSLGAKESSWQSIHLRICILGERMTSSDICEALQLSSGEEFEKGMDQLNLVWSQEHLSQCEALMAKFSDQMGSTCRANKVLTLETDKSKLIHQQAKLAEEVMEARFELANSLGSCGEFSAKMEWMASQQQESVETKATLFTLREQQENLRTEMAAQANAWSLFSRSEAPAQRRREQQRAKSIQELKDSMPSCDTQEFQDKKAEIYGQALKWENKVTAQKLQIEILETQFQGKEHEVSAVKSKIADELKQISEKHKAVGAANQRHFAMMFGAVKEMRRQKECTELGQFALGTLLQDSIKAYNDAVSALAKSPFDTQRLLLERSPEGGRVGVFSKSLGLTSKILMPLLEALTTVDHKQWPKLNDHLTPSCVKTVTAALQAPPTRAPAQIGNPCTFLAVRDLDQVPGGSSSGDNPVSPCVSSGAVPKPIDEVAPVADGAPEPVGNPMPSFEDALPTGQVLVDGSLLGASPADLTSDEEALLDQYGL